MIGMRDISSFYLLWPWALVLLLLVPVWWWLYLRNLRQTLRNTALFFSYAAVAEQLKHRPVAWKRLLQPISTSLVMICLVAALARPTVVGKIPMNSVDMMIVLDISLSMMADDIRPDRIEAAKAAAIQFVESLPRDVRVGLEVFAGDNYVLSPPTSRHEEVTAYLKALRREDLKPRTEIGSALHTALKILNTGNNEQQGGASVNRPTGAENPTANENPPQPPSTASNRRPDRVIVLLSDGDSHEGYPWDQAARDALQQNAVIHAIGIGSPQGAVIHYKGMELPVMFDESTLRHITEIAHGSYFRVFREADFRKVYEQIEARTVHYEEREVDLAFLLAGIGLCVLFIASLLLLLI